MEHLYYVAEVREPDTCRVCGYVVKDRMTLNAGKPMKVPGCPVYPTREKAERYLEGMLSVR